MSWTEEKNKAETKLHQGKQKEEEKRGNLYWKLWSGFSCRLLAYAKCNTSFVSAVGYFPLEKYEPFLPVSPLVSGLWGGQVVAACYKDSVSEKLLSVLH